jgi:proteasome accessory factor C
MVRPVEKIERLANLLFVLRDAKEPLTLVQIAAQVPGYPAETEARRTSFERDKRTLRESGIQITVSSPNSAAQDGYQILASDYYLPDLNLSDSERNALRIALASVRFEGTVHAEIAVKIGADPEATLPAVMELPREAALGPLGEAIRQRSVVSFTYHEKKRLIEPGALYFHAGHWYLIGRDHDLEGTGEQKTFRVDRIHGAVALGTPGGYEWISHSNLAAEIAFSLRASVQNGDGDELDRPLLELLVDPSATASVIEVIGQDVVIERDDEGRARVVFPIADQDAVVSWILGLGAAAKIVAPTSLQKIVTTRLREFADEAPIDGTRFDIPREFSESAPRVLTRATRRPVIDAGARLRRMIAMLTYLANEGSATVPELAERFGIEQATVTSELELAACIGRPPYTPDELLEVIVIDDEVYVNQLEDLMRPLRLTPEEGFALAAAARTLLRVDGVASNGPLATGLEKLESVLGQNRVYIDVDIPASLDVLRRAAATNTVVEIDYASQDPTRVTRRRIEPFAVPFREGKFYLDAFSHEAGDWRRFLVANISNVTVMDEHGEPRALPVEFLGSRAFVEGKDASRVTIVADARCRYFIDPLVASPVVEIEEGKILASIIVGNPEWLGRLLLRLGRGAQVVAPEELQGVKAASAIAALARY